MCIRRVPWDDSLSMGGHECTLPTPKSPSVQIGDGLGCLLKCIEYLILHKTSFIVVKQFANVHLPLGL